MHRGEKLGQRRDSSLAASIECRETGVVFDLKAFADQYPEDVRAGIYLDRVVGLFARGRHPGFEMASTA